MQRTLILLAIVAGCAGAPKQRATCDAVQGTYGLSAPVHPVCALDARPKISRLPRPDFSRLIGSVSSTCYSAEFDVVIDPDGKALPQTAKLVRTSSQAYATELGAVLGDLTYTPPRKDGQPVYALVRFEGKIAARLMTTGAVNNRPPPC